MNKDIGRLGDWGETQQEAGNVNINITSYIPATNQETPLSQARLGFYHYYLCSPSSSRSSIYVYKSIFFIRVDFEVHECAQKIFHFGILNLTKIDQIIFSANKKVFDKTNFLQLSSVKSGMNSSKLDKMLQIHYFHKYSP